MEQADKVFITLADGSTNKIVSNSFTGNEDTNIDGAIFSREDLTLNGSGTLKITSAAHGIVSKDDLVLTGGVYQIQSEKSRDFQEKKVCVLQMEHLRLLPVQMRSTVRIQMKIQKDLFI